MTRRRIAAPAVVLFAALSACSGGETPTSTQPQQQESASPAYKPAWPTEVASTSNGADPLSKATVTLYFPSAAGDVLVPEPREIVDTRRPADRGAQILAELLAGPQAEGSLPAAPQGTMLRQLWVRKDGNAYADFSEELLGAASGGSADEILSLYAIVDSLTQNVPEIQRVGILVAGRQRSTFGHLDVSRPLPPNLSLAQAPKPTE